MSALPEFKPAPLPPPNPALTGKKRPKVSVLLITYNHEKYIGQAIESILAQETEYDYVINVIEDCSTDKTQEVVMRYVEKYPDKVIPFFNTKNIGFKVTQKNLYRGFQTMNGEYLAILEGDDYWNSPYKLQKQVKFLEENPEYVACAHNTIKKYEDGSQEPHRFLYWEGMKEVVTIHDLIYIQAFFHTTTLMYRNVFNGVPPKQFRNPWSCDIFNTIAHAQFGLIRYFDEDMAVYRAHSGGRFSNMDQLDGWLFNINGLRRYNEWLGYRYLKTFAGSIVRYADVILGGAGSNGVKPLTSLQKIKYILIRVGYQFLYDVCSVVERVVPNFKRRMSTIAQRYRESKQQYDAYPTLTSFVQGVYYVFLQFLLLMWLPLEFSLRCLMQVFGGLFQSMYWGTATIIPEHVKNAIRNFEKRHESVHILREYLRDGSIFSKKGAIHLRNMMREACSDVLTKIKPRPAKSE